MDCPRAECGQCGLKGHMSSVCPSPRCRFCSQLGHKQRTCPLRSKGNKESRKPSQGDGPGRGKGPGPAVSCGTAARGAWASGSGPVTQAGAVAVPSPKPCSLAEKVQDLLTGLTDIGEMSTPSFYDRKLSGLAKRRAALEREYRERSAALDAEEEKVRSERAEAEVLSGPLKRVMEAVADLRAKRRRESSPEVDPVGESNAPRPGPSDAGAASTGVPMETSTVKLETDGAPPVDDVPVVSDTDVTVVRDVSAIPLPSSPPVLPVVTVTPASPEAGPSRNTDGQGHKGDDSVSHESWKDVRRRRRAKLRAQSTERRDRCTDDLLKRNQFNALMDEFDDAELLATSESSDSD